MAPIFLDLVTFRASSFSSFESSIRLMARSTHWRASDATQMVYCLNCLRLRTVTENVLGDMGAWLSLALTELQSTCLVPVSSCFLAQFESCVEWFDSGLNWISEYRLVKWCLGLFYANKVAVDWTGMFAIDESIWKLLYSKILRLHGQ